MNFRYDINGLRAIAVVAVVLFHFSPMLVPGGFAGVDVFFVISGFLMTGIIFKGIDSQSFSLLSFYRARANRIIPALAVLCLVLVSLGTLFINPADFIQLVTHALGSMSFLSNIIYWKEAGYFDASSHDKWLLHTWSLSVEWQFYVIYPLIIVLLKKLVTTSTIKLLLLIGTIFGFAFSSFATLKWPEPSYFLLPTRAWEMMMGGVAFLYPWHQVGRGTKRVAEVIGLVLIVGSYFLVDSSNAWPGYLAIFPVLGTYLVIVAAQQSSLFTNNVVFQSLGKWSYSIYLWHWPLVVLGSYFSIENWPIFGIPLSILLGFASYQFIERVNFSTLRLSVTFCVPVLFCSIAWSVIDLKNHPEYIIGQNAVKDGELHFLELGEDHLLNTDRHEEVQVIAIGDSNLAHLGYGIAKSSQLKTLLAASGSCFVFPDYTRKPYASWMDQEWLDRCSQLYKKMEDYPQAAILVGQSWKPDAMICTSEQCTDDKSISDFYMVIEDQIARMSQIVEKGRVINLLGWYPMPESSLIKCTKTGQCQGDLMTRASLERVEINRTLQKISSLHDNVHFIDPFGAICSDAFSCKTVEDGKNLFFDNGGHLSAFGSEKIWPYIEQNLVGIK